MFTVKQNKTINLIHYYAISQASSTTAQAKVLPRGIKEPKGTQKAKKKYMI